MNMSRVVSHIALMLSLNNITLPFKDDITGEAIPAPNIIREVLSTVTIPMYSLYQPWHRQGTANLRELKIADERNSVYFLPESLTTTDVMYVSSVNISTYSDSSMFSGSNMGGYMLPMNNLYSTAKSIASSQMASILAGDLRDEPTFEYLGENKIILYGYPRVNLIFRLACAHEPNGETIEDSCTTSFMDLAMLDMKMFLYNNLKLYDKISNAWGGVIDLKIEEMQGAESDRRSLLEKWDETFHLDNVDWIEFI